jgi:predicted RNase H-like HicB family nuclease
MDELEVIVVKAARDDEAAVWYVQSSDLPGVNAEAETLEELVAKLPGVIADLIEEDEPSGNSRDVRIELIAHASTRIRLPAAA